MSSIKIEKFQPGQEAQVNSLIRRVYDGYIAGDYSDEGNRFFYDWIEPGKITERQREGRKMYVAEINSTIVGVVEVRENNHISLLFVDSAHHGKGIAKKLVAKAVSYCLQMDPALSKVFVHASPFSIPVYKKLGFVEQSDFIVEENGMKYIPMEMTIKR